MNPPERDGWKISWPNLHWDTSLALPIPFGVQGILYLTDTAANQGAFTCVPGFHRRIEAWLKSLPAGSDPQEDLAALARFLSRARAETLIIWHQALPHGSSPNRADAAEGPCSTLRCGLVIGSTTRFGGEGRGVLDSGESMALCG